MRRTPETSRTRGLRSAPGVAFLAIAMLLAALVPLAAQAAPPYPSDTAKPNLVKLLAGFEKFWTSEGGNTLHGTVLDARTLERNDELAVWINNHATNTQQFRALQNAQYDNGSSYDQSISIADGLGTVLGPIYVEGRENGSLPLTSALINSETGSTGAYVSTGEAKEHFSYPRPYLPTDPTTPPVAGDEAACDPATVNGSSLAAIRAGKSYAEPNGNLKIQRVPNAVDTTHEFSPNDVPLTAEYNKAGICKGGAFPSGHTTTAYQAGITLATLLPEQAPEILARTSEAGNNRIVLGVHYPLDIMGGRIDGEVALATRWSDTKFRTEVIEPAREELVHYLEAKCGGTIVECAAKGSPYTDNPYGGRRIPGGTAQIVTDRESAASVYTERLTYGFAPVGPTWLSPAVPAGAANLLLTTYPTLNEAQRTAVLAQTEIPSGYPLDATQTGEGSWERLDLAAAMSATVLVKRDGSVRVLETGGEPTVEEQPSGILTSQSGRFAVPGKKIRLSGSDLPPNEEVALIATGPFDHEGAGTTIGTVTTDGSGAFSTTVTIPRSTWPGPYSIDAIDNSGDSLLVQPLRIFVLFGSPGHHRGHHHENPWGWTHRHHH
jgi:membrane-associated phospholipid phosphatase